VITDADLAAAVEGRAGWQPAGEMAATFTQPESDVVVRVQRVRLPAKRERYMASVVRGGRAAYTMPFHDAEQAVRWAERVQG
jgi:hypothetical protein